MSEFDDIKRLGNNLYRGANGSISNLIMGRIGVGPLVKMARAIVANPTLIPASNADEIRKFLLPKLGVEVPSKSGDTVIRAFVPIPTSTVDPMEQLVDQIDRILHAHGTLVGNPLTIPEHVLWEIEINSPSTARLLESTSKRPQIAVLYAYGLDVEEWMTNQKLLAVRGHLNSHAFVAVMQRKCDEKLALPYEINLASGKYTLAECRRRIDRDQEHLASDIYPVAQCIALPAIQTLNKAALDAAARTLTAHKAAS